MRMGLEMEDVNKSALNWMEAAIIARVGPDTPSIPAILDHVVVSFNFLIIFNFFNILQFKTVIILCL